MTYGKVHRYLLRTIASQGVIPVSEVQKILDRFTESSERIVIRDIVKQINNEIRQFQQQIKITSDEVTTEEVVVFLSLGNDDATRAQNIFSAIDLDYFRLLIEQIMTTESRQITAIHAMNLVGQMKTSTTKTDAQKLLTTWCRMRYLDKINNNYALGVRAIHEFEGYLKENMPDAIEECCLCKQIVFRGYNCLGCARAVHTRCLTSYLEKVRNWPCCQYDFDPEQLERLNNDSSRLTQSQMDTTQRADQSVTQESTQYNTIAEPTLNAVNTQNLDVDEDDAFEILPEVSQRITRKRKRQNE